MIYEQKRFHSADTKYYADLNQICAYLKFEWFWFYFDWGWDCIRGMIITFLADVSLKTLLKEVPVNVQDVEFWMIQ